MKILVTMRTVQENIIHKEAGQLKNAFYSGDFQEQLNRFDDHALEEALKLKEESRDIEVHALFAGDNSKKEFMKKCIGKGCDKSFLIESEKKMTDLIPFSDIIKNIFLDGKYSLIFSGMLEEDMMSGVFPHYLAGKLSIPSVSGVVKIEKLSKEKIIVIRELQGGTTEKLELSIPSVLSFQAGINELSYPNVLKMLKSDDSTEKTIFPDQSRLNDNFMIESLYAPEKTREAKFIEGSREDKVLSLIHTLKSKKLI